VSNKNLVLIVGKSATGKTASLRNIKNPEGVLYLNCESGKELPFNAPFRKGIVSNPLNLFGLLTQAEAAEGIHTIVIDSLTFLMDMFEMVMETLVKVKGALMNQGIESYFNNVIACKVVKTSSLDQYKNDLLTITEDESEMGVKYVFQTRKTKDTVNDRIRGPLGLWKKSETFIDNDLQSVIDKLHEYYGS
jgi:hypothetical protein